MAIPRAYLVVAVNSYTQNQVPFIQTYGHETGKPSNLEMAILNKIQSNPYAKVLKRRFCVST